MKWDTKDIAQLIGGGGVLTALTAIIGSMMGWVRFGKKDKAEAEKLQSEAAVDMATIAEKKISDEIKISDAALQWTINLSTRLEQANAMIDKKQEMIDKEQEENDRLHGIISVMKQDFDNEISKLKESFNKRIRELEKEFEKARTEFLKEREGLLKERNDNRMEIKRLKDQIDGAANR